MPEEHITTEQATIFTGLSISRTRKFVQDEYIKGEKFGEKVWRVERKSAVYFGAKRGVRKAVEARDEYRKQAKAKRRRKAKAG